MPSHSEPTWTSPENYVQTGNYFLQQGVVPFVALQGILLRTLQSHFHDPNRWFNTKLVSTTWDPDAKTSKLFIGPTYSTEFKTAGKRPSLIVKRSTVVPKDPETIPQNVALTMSNTGLNTADDRTYTRIFDGKHIVNCLDQSGSTSEALAEETFQLLLRFSPVIQQDTGLYYLSVEQLGETAQNKTEFGDMWVTPIILTWSSWYSWIVPKEEPW